MRRLSALVAAATLLVAGAGCGGSGNADAPDDAGLHGAVQARADGTEVTFDATVTEAPTDSGGHERFHVRSPAGDVLEVDHNTTLATRAPLTPGEAIVIRGRLYADPGNIGVHCTHAHTSRGCPVPGFIRAGSQTYS